MDIDKIILITTLKNARNLLNSIACESSNMGVHARVSDIITKIGDLERELKK